MSELARAGKTPCQGHQDPSKSVSIFDRETEANLKMVSINPVSFPRSRTVICQLSQALGFDCTTKARAMVTLLVSWSSTLQKELNASQTLKPACCEERTKVFTMNVINARLDHVTPRSRPKDFAKARQANTRPPMHRHLITTVCAHRALCRAPGFLGPNRPSILNTSDGQGCLHHTRVQTCRQPPTKSP